jgi:hypothetical protein
VLRKAGFIEAASHPFGQPQEWTVDSIPGILPSTSVCSTAVLGADAPPFESELRAKLLAHDSAGTYQEDLGWGYTLARKPGRA